MTIATIAEIGCTLAVCSTTIIIFCLTSIGGYLKRIDHTLVSMQGNDVEHKTRLDLHEKRIDVIDEKIYKLNVAS